MKIIRENVIYLQNNDIVVLRNTGIDIPTKSMYNFTYYNQIVPSLVNSDNKYDFIEIYDTKAIDFLKNFEWILDYDQVRKLSKRKLDELIEKLYLEKINIEQNIGNKYSSPIRKAIDLRLIDVQIENLEAFRQYKHGQSEMSFPEELKPREVKRFVFLPIKK